ncbi:MAG: hypothetical protein PHV82_12245 [Victivallaceae bacterium]|nr:hypothetical protein [Victivallaceae bacterium]
MKLGKKLSNKGDDMIDWLNTNQGVVITMLTGVYVVATLTIAFIAKRSNDLARKNIDTLTMLERERLKPAIMIEIYADIPYYCVRIVNCGQTTALDVSFDLKPKLCVLLGGANSVPRKEQELPIGFLDNGIVSLPPGGVVSTVIGTFVRIKDVYPDLIFRGRVTYKNRDNTQYNDDVVLDLRHYRDNLHVEHKTIHDVAKRLEEIKNEFNRFALGLSKPHVLVQDS